MDVEQERIDFISLDERSSDSDTDDGSSSGSESEVNIMEIYLSYRS